jgi:hypothetical protein
VCVSSKKKQKRVLAIRSKLELTCLRDFQLHFELLSPGARSVSKISKKKKDLSLSLLSL